ncbi:unnamed protein product [Ranitomeya imitator]|uniref:Uncharacterized protein n=1 Tax=Ranitomeya imitator TaxID=111125 RepID=A0ABN9LWT9_9NEOB|nr:unnamed protein product [Ranitomeya imitator]
MSSKSNFSQPSKSSLAPNNAFSSMMEHLAIKQRYKGTKFTNITRQKITILASRALDVSAIHGQVDRSSLSSVLRDLVKPGDENLREMNKKLQNMLEEQLTKNMHLQKDLEALSQEIVRLSKECVPAHGSPQTPSKS